jgi:hypothetical protein
LQQYRRDALIEIGFDWRPPSFRNPETPIPKRRKISSFKSTGNGCTASLTLNRNEDYDLDWTRRFEELKLFREKHGHLKVRYSEDKPLYDWTFAQRSAYKNNTLKQERLDALRSVNFEWTNTRQVLSKVVPEHSPVVRCDRAAPPKKEEPRRDLKSARPKKSQNKPKKIQQNRLKKTPMQRTPSSVSRMSSDDSVHDYRPPRAVFEDDTVDSPVVSCIPTYTTVYTVDLHAIRKGLMDKTMNVEKAIEGLKKMVPK